MPAPERAHQNCIITISHVCIASVSMYTGTLSAVYRKIIGCTNSSMILHSSSTVQRRAHRHQSYQSQLNMWAFLENLFTYFFSTWIPCVQFYSLFILYFFFFFFTRRIHKSEADRISKGRQSIMCIVHRTPATLDQVFVVCAQSIFACYAFGCVVCSVM